MASAKLRPNFGIFFLSAPQTPPGYKRKRPRLPPIDLKKIKGEPSFAKTALSHAKYSTAVENCNGFDGVAHDLSRFPVVSRTPRTWREEKVKDVDITKQRFVQEKITRMRPPSRHMENEFRVSVFQKRPAAVFKHPVMGTTCIDDYLEYDGNSKDAPKYRHRFQVEYGDRHIHRKEATMNNKRVKHLYEKVRNSSVDVRSRPAQSTRRISTYPCAVQRTVWKNSSSSRGSGMYRYSSERLSGQNSHVRTTGFMNSRFGKYFAGR